VLALDYLRRSRRITPEIELRALEFINLGWQRLLTFEVEGGGFDWWGKAPANVVLSAYAILEFTDMAKVTEIDRAVIDRTRAWLFSRQQADGSWAMPPQTAWSWTGLGGPYVVTSWIAWSLAESGDRGPEVQRAARWILDHLDAAKDPYARGLAMNALVAIDPQNPETRALVRDIESKKVSTEDGKGVFWTQDAGTAFQARGDFANIEATALILNGLIEARCYGDTLQRGLSWITRVKQANGTWGTTSATVLSLRAILNGIGPRESDHPSDLTLRLNGVERRLHIAPDQSDVLHYVEFTDGDRQPAQPGANTVDVETAGDPNAVLQLVGRCYIPWKDVRRDPKQPLEIEVQYDRAKLAKTDLLTARVRMIYRGSEATGMVVADLGVPPAFTVDESTFEAMTRDGRIDRYTLTARTITLYIGSLKPDQVMDFSFGLRAKYPIKAKTPKSVAYEYYSPDRRDEAEPVELEVTE